jgi:hypothetical protein
MPARYAMIISVCAAILFCALVEGVGDEKASPNKDEKSKDEKAKVAKQEAEKSPAGKAEVLRKLPKKFARFLSADAKRLEVRLAVEGEKEPRTWKISPDAEIKLFGWWGRLEQFQPEQRVWVWFDIDRKQQPRGVLMLADEISEQDIHGQPRTLESLDLKQRTIKLKAAKESVLYRIAPEIDVKQVDDEFELAINSPRGKTTFRLRPSERVFAQTAGEVVRDLLDAEGLKAARQRQADWLCERWRREGLPGTVTFLHRLGGEMEFMLDHEAIRWGRYLKTGDTVTLLDAEEIPAAVKTVSPWRERTLLRLVVGGLEQTDFVIGQRVRLKVPEPPAEVKNSALPPDIGRPRNRAERVEWFLASIYCPCKIGGDGCTGMFYTLASCNVHACHMPNQVRTQVERLIDKGLSDEQIYAELKKTRGAVLSVPHLLP